MIMITDSMVFFEAFPEQTKRKERRSNCANISLDLETPTLGANNLFLIRRLLASRENMKVKGIPSPNLGANILLEAPPLGANNPFIKLLILFVIANIL